MPPQFLTSVHEHVLCTGLAEFAAPNPASGRLKAAATAYRNAIDSFTTTI